MSWSLRVAIHWYDTIEGVFNDPVFCLGLDLVLVHVRRRFVFCGHCEGD